MFFTYNVTVMFFTCNVTVMLFECFVTVFLSEIARIPQMCKSSLIQRLREKINFLCCNVSWKHWLNCHGNRKWLAFQSPGGYSSWKTDSANLNVNMIISWVSAVWETPKTDYKKYSVISRMQRGSRWAFPTTSDWSVSELQCKKDVWKSWDNIEAYSVWWSGS